MTLREAAIQALEALESVYNDKRIMVPREQDEAMNTAITVLRKAITEPEKNPFGDDAERYARKLHEWRESCKTIFTAPTPRKWIWLTEKEIDVGLCQSPYALQTAKAWRDGVEWAQAQLKEKNA